MPYKFDKSLQIYKFIKKKVKYFKKELIECYKFLIICLTSHSHEMYQF